MEILGFIVIAAAFITLVLLMNLRGKAWQDFADRMTKDKTEKDEEEKEAEKKEEKKDAT